MTKKIAVIYSHSDLLDLLEMMLNDDGYQAQLYFDRTQAYAVLPNYQPDLLIIEPTFKKPEIDQQFIWCLRTYPTLSHIPILICTIDTSATADQNKYFQATLDNIEVVPFEIEPLRTTIQNMLNPVGHSQFNNSGRSS